MATFNWPASVVPTEVHWQLVYNSQGFVSPLSGVEQTAELPGARWLATLRFDKLKRAEIAELEALLFKLRGRANRVLLWDHFRERARTGASGPGSVKGAGQTGTSILTDGWSPNITNLLWAADRVSINGELKAITQTISSNALGEATLVFEPPMRVAPSDNALAVVVKPTALMMLTDDTQGRLSTRRSLTSTTLTFKDIT